MAHKDIKKKFKVKDHKTGEVRRFEAVGFLNKGEERVSGNEALARTANENGGTIGDEDVAFFQEHCNKPSKTLKSCFLITNKRFFIGAQCVARLLVFGESRWLRVHYYFDSNLYSQFFVLRRLP